MNINYYTAFKKYQVRPQYTHEMNEKRKRAWSKRKLDIMKRFIAGDNTIPVNQLPKIMWLRRQGD